MNRAFLCVAAVALLAGCGDDTPEPPSARVTTAAAPLSYDYLPKLGLDVSDVVLEDSWTPQPGSGEHVEEEAEPRPSDALARMVHDRVVASGGSGRAVVTIEEASLIRVPGQLVGAFAVQVVLEGRSGDAPPPLVATVSGTRTLTSDDNERASADALVRQLMERMNVELEYQVRRQLKEHLGGSIAPVASPVQTEDLPPPGAEGL